MDHSASALEEITQIYLPYLPLLSSQILFLLNKFVFNWKVKNSPPLLTAVLCIFQITIITIAITSIQY